MLEKKEYKGMWFLPKHPEHKVAGTLYFSPNENIKLELIGSFCETSIETLFADTEDKNTNVIHGIVYSDNKVEDITLFDCYSSQKYNFSCDFPLITYFCRSVFVGKLIESKEDKLFDKIRLFIPCLKDWFSYRPIKHCICSESDTSRIYQWEISEKDKYIKSFLLDDKTTLSFNAVAGFEERDEGGFVLYEDTYVDIETNEKVSYRELYQKAFLFKDFLSLSILSNVPFSEIVLFDYNDYQEYDNGKKRYNNTPVYFVAKDYLLTKHPTYNYLFRFVDIKTEFADIIQKWYAESENLAPIRRHLINSITYKKEFSSIDFLTIIQSVQGYYYRFIDDDQKKHLRKQLDDLYNKFRDIVFVNKNVADYDRVIASRNYYSHFYSKDNQQNICDGRDLYELTKKLRLLLICSTLSLVGFSNQKIESFLKNSNKIISIYA